MSLTHQRTTLLPKTKGKKSAPVIDLALLERAVQRRLLGASAREVQLRFRAVPALTPQYVQETVEAAQGVGGKLTASEIETFRRQLSAQVEEAFSYSQHSSIMIRCKVQDQICKFWVEWRPISVTSHYEEWLGIRQLDLFGNYPDAMVLQTAATLGDAVSAPVLDVGAGVGRNAIPLARLGHPVTAIEPSPSFAARIFERSVEAQVAVRVIQKTVQHPSLRLKEKSFSMIVASQALTDLRGAPASDEFLRKVVDSLRPGGLLVFNVFIAPTELGSNPAIRQAAEAGTSSFLTEAELDHLSKALRMEQVSRSIAYYFERTNLPPEAWPPNSWFENWSRGHDIFALPKNVVSPIQLEWLVWRKGTPP